jgi:hypothetical protein
LFVSGGNLVFKGIKGTESENVENFEYAHVVGKVLSLLSFAYTPLPLSLSISPITQVQGLLHLGKHIHQADNIIDGERYNLIVWCRSKVRGGREEGRGRGRRKFN